MKKLNEEQALDLQVGGRVLVRVLETGEMNIGIVSIIDSSVTSIKEYQDKLGVIYRNNNGFDILEDMFEVDWCSDGEYCEIYKLEEDELAWDY